MDWSADGGAVRELVREASRHGGIRVTDNGRVVAMILPEIEPVPVLYFARRQYVRPGIIRLIESGRLGLRGTDSTIAMSEEREEQA